MFSAAPFGFAACTPDGALVATNAAMRSLAPAGVQAPSSYFDWFPPERRAEVAQWLARLVRAGSSQRDEIWATPRGSVALHVVGWTQTRNGDALVLLTHQRAEPEASRPEQLSILAAMQRVNTVIRQTADLQAMLIAVLDEMLKLFGCDRAWLVYPCDPTSDTWTVPLERTVPAWPGASQIGVDLPMEDSERALFERVLAIERPIAQGPDHEAVPDEVARDFMVRAQLFTAVYPKVGKPWLLGVHHCGRAHVWAPMEIRLLEEIARRVADALSSLLVLRDLRASEERYRTLLEHAPEAVTVLDVSTGRFSYVNPNAAALFGYSEHELLNLGLPDVSPPTQPDGRTSAEVAGEVLARVVAGEAAELEWEHLASDGRRIPCEVRLVRLGPDDKQVRGSIIDISERLRMERHLRQVQKMEAVGQLAGGVAHDFNNLLTVIKGYTDILRFKAGGPELEAIAEASDQAAHLTKQLLMFSRGAVVQPRAVDPTEAVAAMGKLLHRVIREDIALTVTHEGPPSWHVMADPVQLQQILLNLAVNARDAMPGGGRLSIETRNTVVSAEDIGRRADLSPGRYVALAVTDTGVGMDAKTQENIFDPFFTTKAPGRGTGLGLATVRRIVRQLQGSILVYSEPGHGTCFKVLLPVTDAEGEAVVDEADASPPPTGCEMILLVEDAEDVRTLVRRLLEQAGYEVLVAVNAEEALELFERRSGDVSLLVTDVVMPGLNGRELSDRLRTGRPDLPTLFVSGYTPGAILPPDAVRNGTAFLSKPFSPVQLLRTIRNLCDSAP